MRGLPVALAAMTLVLLAGSVPWSDGQAAYGYYHDLGPAELLAGHDVRLAHGGVPELGPQDAYLVVAPQLPFTPHETARLRAFLDGGGRVLIAGAEGPAAQLIEALEVGIRVPEAPIVSPVALDGDPLFFATGAMEGVPDPIALKAPLVLRGDAVPVLQSSSLAWLDTDRDGRPDLEEPQSTYSAAMLATAGDGAVLVLSDPVLLEHDAFLDWLDGATVVVDEAHRPQADPVGIAPLLAGQRTASLIALEALAAVAFTAWAVRLRLTRPKRQRPVPADDALTQAVLAELP